MHGRKSDTTFITCLYLVVPTNCAQVAALNAAEIFFRFAASRLGFTSSEL